MKLKKLPVITQIKLFFLAVAFVLLGLTQFFNHFHNNLFIDDIDQEQLSLTKPLSGDNDPPSTTPVDLFLCTFLLGALFAVTHASSAVWERVSRKIISRLIAFPHIRPRSPPLSLA